MIEPDSRLRLRQLADLKPPRYLSYYRTAAPGVGPVAGDALRGGRRGTTGVSS